MKTIPQFYENFYGKEFHRHFRRIPDFNPKEHHFRVQYQAKDPKSLYLQLKKNSGFHSCLISVNSYQNQQALEQHDKNSIIYDRIFFDFDISNQEAKSLKKDLIKIRSHGLHHQTSEQQDLKDQLQSLVVNDEIAKPAFEDAIKFSEIFKESMGCYPALFFSGGKGCHAYCFFNPIKLKNPDESIHKMAKLFKDTYQLETMDLSVNKDASVRLSRLPYSEHPHTGLNVVPFQIGDTYQQVINNSINPKTDKFIKDFHISGVDNLLLKLDTSISLEKTAQSLVVKQERRKRPRIFGSNRKDYSNLDHREFFLEILGKPESEYPLKEYVMYKCPFHDHNDEKPSFRVHKTGFYCYGCQRKGNYWQFLKDFNGWNDEQVKEHLRD